MTQSEDYRGDVAEEAAGAPAQGRLTMTAIYFVLSRPDAARQRSTASIYPQRKSFAGSPTNSKSERANLKVRNQSMTVTLVIFHGFAPANRTLRSTTPATQRSVSRHTGRGRHCLG